MNRISAPPRNARIAGFVPVALIAMCTIHTAMAEQTLPLYDGAIPNSIEVPDEEALRDPKEPYPFFLSISRPTITIHRAAGQGVHPAIVILPGGSYRGVSIVKEGHDVARAFNAMGITALVVKYRTPSERHMTNRSLGALQDAQRAMWLARQRADEWGIDARRVGLLGFSAGGHLAATVATRFNQPVLREWQGANLRPDFLILMYPVINLGDDIAHATSREMLLGAQPSKADKALFSADLAVTADAPPTFLIHAADDAGVPVANSIRYFEALQSHGVAAQLYIYTAGGHGFGLNNATTTDRWIDRVQTWLIAHQWLPAAAPERASR